MPSRVHIPPYRATVPQANIKPVVGEAAEMVVYRLVRTSERKGIHRGEETQNSIDDVIGDLDFDGDPGDDGLPSGHSAAPVEEREEVEVVRRNGGGQR